jgi:hypothetical protein
MDEQTRPLFKHIRNHDALFSELALIRNNYIASLGLKDYRFHKTPKQITPSGQRLSIEPERSIVIHDYKAVTGVKPILCKQLAGFSIIPDSDIGFRYPTAALAGLEAPYIKRFRSEYFHRVDEHRDICRPINLSYGIKSRGKSDNREEYEVWVPEDKLSHDPSPLFIEKYAEDLPKAILDFASQPPLVHGWMGVKRCAFEGIYQEPSLGDIAVCIALSLDSYNIGARPDLSFSEKTQSSIACGGAEFEWEVLGFYCPDSVQPSQEQIWYAINKAIDAISEPLETAFSRDIVASDESKTERILSAVFESGTTVDEVESFNLKPWEFLQTQSEYRKKPRDNTRSINLLGRLNRLFYNPEYALPSLRELHHLAALEI